MRALATAAGSTSPDRFAFFKAALTALLSIADIAASRGVTRLIAHVFDFASHFLPLVDADIGTASTALHVMSPFGQGGMIVPDQVLRGLLPISKLLPRTFNDRQVLKFLTSVILDTTDAHLKTSCFAVLLPIFFAAISAYLNVVPFSSFVRGEVINDVISSAVRIGSSDFPGISDILTEYFSNDAALLAQHKPSVPLDALTAELCDRPRIYLRSAVTILPSIQWTMLSSIRPFTVSPHRSFGRHPTSSWPPDASLKSFR
jgi:hypothetical protein